MQTAVQNESKTWVEISEKNLIHNINVFKSLAKNGAKVMAVIKSNAYGHGLIETAQIAKKAGIQNFAVDSLQEAIKLRDNGIEDKILILGYVRPINIKQAIIRDISFVIYDDEVAEELHQLSNSKEFATLKAKVHLKIETGTVRQGLKGEDLLKFVNKIKDFSNVEIEGAYTHFANIEDTTDHTFAKKQLENFNNELRALESIGVKPEIKHTACSAAALLFPDTHFDLIRLGVSMYGFWSSKETRAVAQSLHDGIELKPAMTWKTVIAQVKDVPAGTAISYGLTEKVSRQSKIAVLPIGYWDGYDRGLSSVGTILVHGIRCKIIGRICMNMCMVDVTDVPDPKPGDEVVLLGSQESDIISADDVAAKIGTINYEVVTRINPLIPRVVIE